MSDNEDTDDGIRVRSEISIRNYERQQLTEFLPDIIDVYEEFDSDEMDDRVATFESMLTTFDEDIDGDEERYDLGADQWRDLAIGLDELDDTRASWLSAKIGRRAELESIRMGFTTVVPFMSLRTGKTPVRPDE